MTPIIIDKRYCGPPNSGNGGYVCGRLARHIPGGAEITLRAPPPLDTPLDAIAIGMLIDALVVVVENIVGNLSKHEPGKATPLIHLV
ncbi:hypothetical protein MOV74_28970, partial [Bradyrhizobium sp. SHOUNA76]|nr:hypothetical protein [Bradyrhizobium sp. SHOUNA76]